MTTPASTIPNAEPNVTPMIDVLLVLLIVFMMMAVQVHKTIDVQLPQECSGDCASDVPIVLEVLPGPSFQLNRRPIAASALVSELTAVYRGRPDKILHVDGHTGVRYDEVVMAMDAAKSAGVTAIGIVPRAALSKR